MHLVAWEVLVHCLSLLVLEMTCKDKLVHSFTQVVCALLTVKPQKCILARENAFLECGQSCSSHTTKPTREKTVSSHKNCLVLEVIGDAMSILLILFWKGISCVDLHSRSNIYRVTSLCHSSLLLLRQDPIPCSQRGYFHVMTSQWLHLKEEVFLQKRKRRAAMLLLASSARQGHTMCPHNPIYMEHSHIYLHRDCTQAWLVLLKTYFENIFNVIESKTGLISV